MDSRFGSDQSQIEEEGNPDISLGNALEETDFKFAKEEPNLEINSRNVSIENSIDTLKPGGYGLELTNLRPQGGQTCQLDKYIVSFPANPQSSRIEKQ